MINTLSTERRYYAYGKNGLPQDIMDNLVAEEPKHSRPALLQSYLDGKSTACPNCGRPLKKSEHLDTGFVSKVIVSCKCGFQKICA